ncbi:MAG TPA: ArsA-related P-loop ATPase [Microthrixaceae bacterium]|nr:ArsA-related P-loop ATPase [Microthrixaceae bacterium]
MDPAQFLTAPRVTIVAGKGGVGKTTVTATLAMAAAHLGLRALVIEVEGKSGLPALFGKERLDYEEQVLFTADGPHGAGEVRARTLTPDESLVEWLRDHGLKRISKRLGESGAIELIATATPGIKDVLILGKVKQLESRGAADVIIVDAPAAGHAITFLSSAQGMLDAVTVGPIEAQAREVRNLLTDASRCQVVLVTLPEETPVNEVIETAYSLEDRIGIKLGPVVVNGIYPDLPGLDQSPTAAANAEEVELSTELAAALEAAATFRRDRQDLQRHQLSRLAKDLPLDQVRLPFVFRSDLGLDSLRALSESLVEQLGRLDAVGSPS